jgi:SAM-dependent methyltransferase
MSALMAFSVFTHIDELELAWLCEVRRVLKPGGIAYVTLCTDHTWGILTPEEPLYKEILASDDLVREHHLSAESFSRPMPADRMVIKGKAKVYNRVLFHSTSYVHSVWGRFLRVAEIVRKASGYQDVAVLVKS